MKLYGTMTATLTRDLVSSDGKRKIPAGSVVELQFSLYQAVHVVKSQRNSGFGDIEILASLKEVTGCILSDMDRGR